MGEATAAAKKWPSITLVVIYVNVTLYALCYMAQVPLMPYLLKQLGAEGNTQYGRLQTVFSIVQFFGGLISGPFVDRYGGRSLMLVSFAASIICYSMTATASNVWMLYISRLPTVLQHAILAARTMVTERSSDEGRARALGYVGMAYGLGFALGPALGGLLSSAGSLRTAAWVATAGSCVSLAMVAALLPADAPRGAAAAAAGKEPAGGDGGGSGSGDALAAQRGRSRGVFHMMRQFREVAAQPGVLHLLAAKLIVGLGFAVFQTMFPVLLQQQYGLDSRGNGLVLSYLGLLFMAVQALLVGPATRHLGEARAEHACCWVLLASFVALALARRLWQLLALLVPLSAAGMLNGTLNTSRLTKAVSPHQRGTVLALDMSLFSGVRMVSPALGAALVERLGFAAVGGCAAAMVGLLIVLAGAGLVRTSAAEPAQLAAAAAAANGGGEKGVDGHVKRD